MWFWVPTTTIAFKVHSTQYYFSKAIRIQSVWIGEEMNKSELSNSGSQKP